jgi:hypothetical protein
MNKDVLLNLTTKMKWITSMNDTDYQSSVKKIENLDSTICAKEIEFVLKSFPTKKIPGLSDFTSELFQTVKEKYYKFYIDFSRF